MRTSTLTVRRRGRVPCAPPRPPRAPLDASPAFQRRPKPDAHSPTTSKDLCGTRPQQPPSPAPQEEPPLHWNYRPHRGSRAATGRPRPDGRPRTLRVLSRRAAQRATKGVACPRKSSRGGGRRGGRLRLAHDALYGGHLGGLLQVLALHDLLYLRLELRVLPDDLRSEGARGGAKRRRGALCGQA